MLVELKNIEVVGSGLDHPEDMVKGNDGFWYAGGELGQIYKIDASGKVEELCCTGGYSLGMNFGPDGSLYVCDGGKAAVLKVEMDGSWSVFADQAGNDKLRVPNYPVFDSKGNLYVSDSGDWKGNNGVIYKFNLDGSGEVFSAGPFQFPNGLTLDQDEKHLYVIESNANRVLRIPLNDGKAAGEPEEYVSGIENVPDGLMFDPAGNLYVSCFANNRIYRVLPEGKKEILIEDPDGIEMAAPTNCVVTAENELVFSNLNGDFIGKIKLPGGAGQ